MEYFTAGTSNKTKPSVHIDYADKQVDNSKKAVNSNTRAPIILINRLKICVLDVVTGTDHNAKMNLCKAENPKDK